MRRGILLILLGLLLMGQARGADLFGAETVKDALPTEAARLLEDRDPTDLSGVSGSLRGILRGALGESRGAIRTSLGLCLRLLAVVLLSAVLRSGGEQTRKTMVLAGALAVGSICAGDMGSFFALASGTVEDLTVFSGFLLSSLAAATAAGGAAGTATALYGLTAALLSGLLRVTGSLVLPGVGCYAALSLAGTALEDPGLTAAAGGLKTLLSLGLKLSVLAMTTCLGVTGVISGSADAAAVKAARLTISAAVPVVGSMIADASETLLVSASLIRGGLGIFGLLGVLAVTVTPFLRTGAACLLLKLTAAAAALTGEKSLSDLIGAMGAALGLLTALTAAAAAVLFVAVVCFLRAGGSY